MFFSGKAPVKPTECPAWCCVVLLPKLQALKAFFQKLLKRG